MSSNGENSERRHDDDGGPSQATESRVASACGEIMGVLLGATATLAVASFQGILLLVDVASKAITRSCCQDTTSDFEPCGYYYTQQPTVYTEPARIAVPRASSGYAFIGSKGTAATDDLSIKYHSRAFYRIGSSLPSQLPKFKGSEGSFSHHAGVWIPLPAAATSDVPSATEGDASNNRQHISHLMSLPILTCTHGPVAQTVVNVKLKHGVEPVNAVPAESLGEVPNHSGPPTVSAEELQQIGHSLAMWLRRSTWIASEGAGDEQYVRGITMAVNEKLRMYWDALKPCGRQHIITKSSLWDIWGPSLSIQDLRSDELAVASSTAQATLPCRDSESDTGEVDENCKYGAHAYDRHKPSWFCSKAVLKGFSPTASRPTSGAHQ